MESSLNQLYQDIGALKAESKAHTQGIRELNEKLDGLRADIRNISAVSKADWEKRNSYVDTKLIDHSTRLKRLEELQLVEASGFFTKLRGRLTDNAATLVAGVFLTLFVLALVFMARNNDIGKMMGYHGQRIHEVKAKGVL